jgi:hypothetical protein
MTVRINLIPNELKLGVKSKSSFSKLSFILALTALIPMLASTYTVCELFSLKAEVRLERAKIADSERMRAEAVSKNKALKKELERATEKVNFLLGGLSPSLILPGISAMVPQNIELSSFFANKKRAVLEGTALSDGALTALIKNLTESEFVSEVHLPDTKGQSFKISCSLVPMAETKVGKAGSER